MERAFARVKGRAVVVVGGNVSSWMANVGTDEWVHHHLNKKVGNRGSVVVDPHPLHRHHRRVRCKNHWGRTPTADGRSYEENFVYLEGQWACTWYQEA
jgi:hypothetical protein